MKPKPWDRKLWGAVWTAPSGRSAIIVSVVFGEDYARRVVEKGESTHAMTFMTREACRAWIRYQRATYPGYGAEHLRPVRVRERVEVCHD